MPVPACSRPLLPGQVLSHVVAICGVGISPNSVSCSHSQRSFFAACFVADGVEIQVVPGHWMSLVLMTKQSKTSLKVEFVRILFTEFQRHVRHVPLVSSCISVFWPQFPATFCPQALSATMVETNLGEFLLTATEAMPQKVCLESEAAAYTFEHLALMVASIRRTLRKALLKLELPQGASAEIRSHERRADEHVVIVLLERGVKNIAAVHAVMLERCAYNAFDVAEPVEKLRCWVAISCPPVMISTQAVLTSLRLNLSVLGDFPRYVLDVDQALKSKHNPIAAKFDVEDRPISENLVPVGHEKD